MKYFKLTTCDIANGLGIRTSIWLTGCSIQCPGCHMKDLWLYEIGHEFTVSDILDELTQHMNKPYMHGISILGGEPLIGRTPGDLTILSAFIDEFKSRFPDKDIWIYSGGIFATLMNNPLARDIIYKCDYLVSEPFIISQRDTSLAFRGSRNQKIWHITGTDLINITDTLDEQ